MHDVTTGSAEAIREALNRKALASARHRAALGRLLGLGDSEVLALQHLARAGELTPAQLADLLQLTSGGVTALVQRLERAGHLAREPHRHDRRSTVLHLTPEIERRAEEAFAPLVQEIDGLSRELSAHDRGVVARYLVGVADAAEREAEQLVRRAGAVSPESLGVPSPGLWA
jgi:DNA-binding MarR family transcriptional regulator